MTPLHDTDRRDEEPRDWDAYFLWNTVYLLRSLKVYNALSDTQKRLVEEHCKLKAGTVREHTAAVAKRAEVAGALNELRTLLSEAAEYVEKYDIEKRIAELNAQLKEE